VIGFLRGVVIEVNLDGSLLLDVQGVGYDLSVPTTLAGDVHVADLLSLMVHTHVREDAIVLFGFATSTDRSLFRLLLSVSGVGPATALGALSVLPAANLARALGSGDLDALATIPGVGKKTAARIALELQGKVAHLDDKSTAVAASADVTEALRALGYSVAEIRRALEGVALPDDEAAALKVALRQLGAR
jgi:Holliday junction DNA helicase RuvA